MIYFKILIQTLLIFSYCYFIIKLVASYLYKPFVHANKVSGKIAVVISFYNEAPELFEKCLESILGQSHTIDEIYIADDGSRTLDCYNLAQKILIDHPNVHVKRFEENRGKRYGQSWGFRKVNVEFVAVLDSDTVLENDAIEKALIPFNDSKVNAVCGNLKALNWQTNWITKAIGVRYQSAYEAEYAPYSYFGAVLCASGEFSLHRTKIIKENLDFYLKQKIGGKVINFGDDRTLTLYALKSGKVVFQKTAQAYTNVPDSLWQYFRQQLRWNKAWLYGNFLLLTNLGNRGWWLSLAELFTGLFFIPLFLISFVVQPIFSTILFGACYFIHLLIPITTKNFEKLGKNYFTAPFLNIIKICLAMPIRLFSLFTLRDISWGTRKNEK